MLFAIYIYTLIPVYRDGNIDRLGIIERVYIDYNTTIIPYSP